MQSVAADSAAGHGASRRQPIVALRYKGRRIANADAWLSRDDFAQPAAEGESSL
jgi:hypothetical protein